MRSFRSLVRNTSYLAISKGVAAIAGIATLAFAGRSLGLVQFGLLVLIASYAQAASGLTKFQSWQLIIRYGGAALTSGDADDVQAVGRLWPRPRLSSGLVGMVAAMLLLPLVGPWTGIRPVPAGAGHGSIACSADHGCRRADRGAEGPGPVRPDQLAGVRPIRSSGRCWPASAGGKAGGCPKLRRHLVRHRPRRRFVYVVPRRPRVEAERHARGHPAVVECQRAARGLAVRHPGQRPLVADEVPGVRWPGSSSAACSARPAPLCTASPPASPTAPRSPPICSPRPIIPRSSGWTSRPSIRGA